MSENKVSKYRQTIIEILPPLTEGVVSGDEKTLMTLHPLYPANFNSIFGKTYNIKNLLTLLTLDDSNIRYVNKRLNSRDITKLMKSKRVHRPNYWELITLNMVDRVFKDKQIIKYMLNDPIKIIESEIIVINNIHRGVMSSQVRDKISGNYDQMLSTITLAVHNTFITYEHYNHKDDLLLISDESYTELTNEVKTVVFNKMLERTAGERIIHNLSNDELLKEYLK